MELPGNSGSGEANFPTIDEELTCSVLTAQARRKLLVALADRRTSKRRRSQGKGEGE